MKTLHQQRAKQASASVMMLALALWLLPATTQAAVVSQLDIAGGSISLDFGSLGTLAGSFTQTGQLVMGQYQPPPNIIDPITIGHLMFSIFTSDGGSLNLPPPTAETSGTTITADLRSLFAGVTNASSGWGGILGGGHMPLNLSLNIGGHATGSFNEGTKAFGISWTHPFTGIPYLTSGTFSLHGTAQLAPVPLPAAAWLFGSGIIGLWGVAGRQNSRSPESSCRSRANLLPASVPGRWSMPWWA
jgi:hypothetical protein